ncbi:MAG: hypothetical protein CVV35_11925, partial [Methanomicrobiales archaeon HGW-Methanomicrobiales-6]
MKVDYVLKAITAVLAVVVFLFLFSPAFTETVLPGNFYQISITDLPGPAVNGTTTVMVPLPANATGEPVIPEGTFSSGRVVGW